MDKSKTSLSLYAKIVKLYIKKTLLSLSYLLVPSLDTHTIVLWLKIDVSESVKIGGRFGKSGPDFWLSFEMFASTKIGAWSDKIGARFCAEGEK